MNLQIGDKVFAFANLFTDDVLHIIENSNMLHKQIAAAQWAKLGDHIVSFAHQNIRHSTRNYAWTVVLQLMEKVCVFNFDHSMLITIFLF